MSVSVEVINLRQSPVAHQQMSAIASLGSKTKTYKQVEADDMSPDYDDACKMGIAVVEDGVAHTGTLLFTVTATSTVADRAIVADVNNALNQTLTLPAIAGFETGDRIWIYLRTKPLAGNLIVEGNAAETVLGAANQTLDAAGEVLRLESNGTAWVAPTSLA